MYGKRYQPFERGNILLNGSFTAFLVFAGGMMNDLNNQLKKTDP